MSKHYGPTALTTSRVRGGLLLVWGLCTAAALGFVARFGSNVPYMEEWNFVPVLTGNEPSLPWLWELHNEHRMVLPRALVYGLFTATHDFRTGMFVQVVLLSGLSLGLMRFAARLRGRALLVDTFFPLSLLHFGHWENFLMGYQICFALFTLLATGLGVAALSITPANAGRRGLAAGGLLFLLALTGGAGVILVPPVALWLGILAAWLWRDGRRTTASGVAAVAALTLGYLALYFVGYAKPDSHPEPGAGGGWNIVRVAGQTLAMSFGIGIAGVWLVIAAALSLLSAFTFVLLIRKSLNPETRLSGTGMIAILLGLLGVCLAIGIGRGGMGPEMGLYSRYSLLSWPVIGLSYLIWVKTATAGGWKVPVVLWTTALLALPANVDNGWLYGQSVRNNAAALEDAYRTGAPPEVAAARHLAPLGLVELGTRVIPMLRDAQVGSFTRRD